MDIFPIYPVPILIRFHSVGDIWENYHNCPDLLMTLIIASCIGACKAKHFQKIHCLIKFNYLFQQVRIRQITSQCVSHRKPCSRRPERVEGGRTCRWCSWSCPSGSSRSPGRPPSHQTSQRPGWPWAAHIHIKNLKLKIILFWFLNNWPKLESFFLAPTKLCLAEALY